MLQLVFAGIGLVLWALYIILTYYSKSYSSIDHIEVAAGYGGYLITIIVLYSIYKIATVFFMEKKQLKFNFWHIAGASISLFLVLCIVYTGLPSVQTSPLLGDIKPSSLTLFFHSVGLLIYPIALILITRSAGASVLQYIIKDWKSESLRLRFLVDTSVGLFLFTIGLLIIGYIGAYSLPGLLIVLGVLIVVGIPGFITTYHDIRETSVTFENHTSNGGLLEAIAPKLLSAEFAFLAINFLIGVSLISALRPMPIGWDDLGVYMNYPKIMAMTGHYLLGAGMYSWQLITGTGFLFSYTAAQAFYVNQLGGILAVIAITSTLSLIFEDSKKKYLLALPIIFAAIFYAMPMNIFQQAKDMKLDPALLAVSISGLAVLFSGWKAENNKKNLLMLGLAGLIIGFAFSIKFTSLMLVIGGFALIAYRILSVWGFVGFFFLFLSIFTKAGFWGQLNVWMPTDNGLINSISLGLGIVAIVSFVVAWRQSSTKQVQSWFISSIIFLVGILAGMSPWIIKNTSEVQAWNAPATIDSKTLVLNSILNGSGGTFVADFTKLYSKEEYNQRTNDSQSAAITGSGQSQNEDLGRYFGYDKGINNYMRMPANLTFQKNQSGEFTDITYIFLAFFPVMLLFVRGRRGIYASGIGALILFLFSYFFTTKGGGDAITQIFSLSSLSSSTIFGEGNSLLVGYIILIVLNLSFLIFSHYLVDDRFDENKKLKEMLILFGTYGFIFLISAFGIVWYGILIYFILFALIGLASSSFTGYSEKDAKDEDTFGIKVTLTAIFFIFILVYFIRSAFPHGWNNLDAASYNEFKYNILSQEESIFAYRQDYIAPIAALNVKDPPALIEQVKKLATNDKLKTFFASDEFSGISMKDFVSVLLSLSRGKDLPVAKDAKKIGDILYKNILYPSKADENTGGIYRIGTFMTYLINNNRGRYLDDSLVSGFESYFYDPSPELTIDRMKKLGLRYLLVDLNAATIDKDPRHDLTTRFEHLLTTMKAKNLTLVDTDSICLELALDEYKKGKFQDDTSFIDIAGTNYESYRTQSGQTKMVYRGQKQQNCYNYILKRLYIDNAANEYPYLANLKSVIDSNGAIGKDGQVDQQKLTNVFSQYVGQSWFALFEINDNPVNLTKIATPTIPSVISSGSSASGGVNNTGGIQ